MKNRLSTLLILVLLLLQVLTLNACFSSGADGEGETDAGLSDTEDPFSLPVTIAKLDNGVDPESLTMSLAVSMTTLVSGEGLTPDTIVGTVSGSLESPETTLVGVKVDGAYVDTVQATDGEFSYSLPYQYYNTEVDFVVFGEDASPENETAVSTPVTVKVSYNSDDGQLVMTVAVPPETSSETDNDTSSSTEESVVVRTIVLGEDSESSTTEADTSSEEAETDTDNDTTEETDNDTTEEEPTAPTNTAPTVSDLSLNVGLDSLGRVYPNPVQAQQSTFSATDADGDALTYSIVTSPTLGDASFADNVLTYTPTEPFTGSDTFTIKASDGQVDSNVATVTVSSDLVSTAALESTDFTAQGTALTYQAGTFAETYGVQAGTVAYDAANGNYVMYFESQTAAADGTCTGGYWSIARAVSTDGGDTWTHDASPVLAPVASTNYSCSLGQPGVVYDGEKYHLFTTTKKASSSTAYIAYSSSTDGLTFTSPVSLTSGTVGFPSAILVNEQLAVYYYIKSGSSYYINRIWSDDAGTTWDAADVNTNMISTLDSWSDGTLFEATSRIVTHSAFYDSSDSEAPYKIYAIGIDTTGSTTDDADPYYVGGLLESADGITWGLSDTLPVVPNPDWYWHHEILLHGHNYLMFYKTLDGSSKAVINLSTTYSAWP